MAEVHSHDGEMAGAETAIKKLADMGAGEVTMAKSVALKHLVAGHHIQLLASAGKERTAVYAAWLAEFAGPALVVCGTVDEAEAIKGFMSEHKIHASSATTGEAVKDELANGGVVVGQASAVASAFKGSSKPEVRCCVVDAVDSIVGEASLGDLESFLLSFREANPEAQLVLIGSEPSLNMSALSRRFQADSKVCSILARSVDSLEHVYYEVATNLLAKPQALCDLLELEGGASCIVFCNSPSDADFADVVLKKRGIASQKLIGYVPQIKLSKAIVSIQKKEVTTLVLTDVAARGVPLEDFDVVVNYSMPSDPEVYFHRIASGSDSKTKKVISLVAALDVSNFHYLKKLGKLEFRQAELPTAEQLFMGKFAQLRTQAVEGGVLNDPTIVALVDKILADGNAKDIVGLLLHNTITVLPSMKSATSSQEEFSEDYESDEGSDEDFGNRRGGPRRGGGRDAAGRDGGGRDARDGGRDGGGRRGGGRDGGGRDAGGRDGGGNRDVGTRDSGGRDGNRRTQGRGSSNVFHDERGQQDEEGQQPRRGRRGGQDGERSGEGRREREQRPPRKPMVVDKEARLYVGAGSKQGLSQETLTQDLVTACGLEAGDVHRVSIRPLYSFVDVPEAVAAKVLDKLPETSIAGAGGSYFVRKAVTLSIPREGVASESDEGGQHDAPHNGDDAHFDHEHSDGHSHQHSDQGGEDSDQGPTLLAVDEM